MFYRLTSADCQDVVIAPVQLARAKLRSRRREAATNWQQKRYKELKKLSKNTHVSAVFLLVALVVCSLVVLLLLNLVFGHDDRCGCCLG